MTPGADPCTVAPMSPSRSDVVEELAQARAEVAALRAQVLALRAELASEVPPKGIPRPDVPAEIVEENDGRIVVWAINWRTAQRQHEALVFLPDDGRTDRGTLIDQRGRNVPPRVRRVRKERGSV